jgi:hypothetical protein
VEAEANAWVLDLEQPDAGWQPLPPLPAPGRMLACVGVQGGMLVVAGGTALGVGQDGVATRQPTTTAFALPIDRAAADWRRLSDPPRPIIAAPAPALALGLICCFSAATTACGPRRDRPPTAAFHATCSPTTRSPTPGADAGSCRRRR